MLYIDLLSAKDGITLPEFHPLHVSKFYPHLTKMRGEKKKERQSAILAIAGAWLRLTQNGKFQNCNALLEDEVYITNLTRKLRDVKVILDVFFSVKKLGYNFHNGIKNASVLVPKAISEDLRLYARSALMRAEYCPGPEPAEEIDLTVSKVSVRKGQAQYVTDRLREEHQLDILPMVNWLLHQKGEINFYFRPAGKLQQRDTSVWPIVGIERWPSWLREKLFGSTVDLENSYAQFLVNVLKHEFKDTPQSLAQFNHIIAMVDDKENFRRDLCENLLKLPYDDKGIKIVKEILMAIANGSNVSARILQNGFQYNRVARIIITHCPDISEPHLEVLGNVLASYAKQFRRAKRRVCLFLNLTPNRTTMKEVFRAYFVWERKARYKLWNHFGKTGLMLHDGIDGVSTANADDVKHIARSYGLKTSISLAPPDEVLVNAITD